MNILLIDDDQNIYNLLKAYMNRDFELKYAKNLEVARELIKKNRLDLILLDIQIESENGLEFFLEMKEELQKKSISVFLLSQVQDIKVKLEAFQFGALDYIVKPFEPLELIARINAKKNTQVNSDIFDLDDLSFNLKNNTITVNNSDIQEALTVTPIEFRLLHFLAQKEERIFSRKELLECIWPEDLHVVDRVVDQHISRLRKKLKNSHFTIKTHPNIGYSLVNLYKNKQAS